MGKSSAKSDVWTILVLGTSSQLNRREKVLTPPPTKLPTLVLEIVESRVIARLKAKNEKNAVESSVSTTFLGLREENGRKTSELEKSGFGCFGMRKVVFR